MNIRSGDLRLNSFINLDNGQRLLFVQSLPLYKNDVKRPSVGYFFARKPWCNLIVMMRNFVFFILFVCCLAACNNEKKDSNYRISGNVAYAGIKMDSVWVYLESVTTNGKERFKDSVRLVNGSFVFTGNKERLASIHLPRAYRYLYQELLVVTENGNIHVSIDEKSAGFGTPQNDSLQLWKNITEQFHESLKGVHDSEQRKYLYDKYVERTISMGHNIGDDTTLGKFLLGMYHK
jgi:hypothetical protein